MHYTQVQTSRKILDLSNHYILESACIDIREEEKERTHVVQKAYLQEDLVGFLQQTECFSWRPREWRPKESSLRWQDILLWHGFCQPYALRKIYDWKMCETANC